MIGLDTNVLVRYVAQDDSKQSPKASRLIELLTAESPGYVSLVSVVEHIVRAFPTLGEFRTSSEPRCGSSGRF
jgi:predicted nucleic-acid-binding protein